MGRILETLSPFPRPFLPLLSIYTSHKSATKREKERMGRPSERDKRCKKHPKHMQSKGVCPSCLSEKLYQLSAPSSSRAARAYGSSTSSSCSSPYTSDDSDLSSCALTPPRTTVLSRRLKTKAGKMAKSRSFGFIAKKRKEEEREEHKEEKEKEKKKEKERKKKNGRFWSKLTAGSTRRKEEDVALFHSKTMREKSSSKWALFA